MKRSELESIIEEEIYKYLGEKSVPEPYNRKSPPRRPMNSSQVTDRDKIGKSMENNKKVVARFKKKFGKDWESYLWAAATNKAMGGKPTKGE